MSTVAVRVRLFVLLLVALAVVAVGVVAREQASRPQADPACYYVISFFPYPHQVLYCPSGGGGSW